MLHQRTGRGVDAGVGAAAACGGSRVSQYWICVTGGVTCTSLRSTFTPRVDVERKSRSNASRTFMNGSLAT